MRVPGEAPGKRPIYAPRKVKNAQLLLDWARKQGISNLVSADKLHVTLAYSKAPIDVSQVEKAGPIPPVTEFGKPKRLGDAIVLPIKGEAAKALTADWQRFMDAGASWDYETFQPHVTISYTAEGQDLSGVEPFTGSITLADEEAEPLDTNAGALPVSREPVATLTGKELGEWEDMRQLGKKVEAWYRENLIGKTVVNEASGMAVQVPPRRCKEGVRAKRGCAYAHCPRFAGDCCQGRCNRHRAGQCQQS